MMIKKKMRKKENQIKFCMVSTVWQVFRLASIRTVHNLVPIIINYKTCTMYQLSYYCYEDF